MVLGINRRPESNGRLCRDAWHRLHGMGGGNISLALMLFPDKEGQTVATQNALDSKIDILEGIQG